MYVYISESQPIRCRIFCPNKSSLILRGMLYSLLTLATTPSRMLCICHQIRRSSLYKSLLSQGELPEDRPSVVDPALDGAGQGVRRAGARALQQGGLHRQGGDLG